VKSQSSSLAKSWLRSVWDRRPRRSGQSEDAFRTLAESQHDSAGPAEMDRQPSDQKPGWLREVGERPALDAQWTLT